MRGLLLIVLCGALFAGASPAAAADLQLTLAEPQLQEQASGGAGALDFDLLGERKQQQTALDGRQSWRRGMLTGHQAFGIGLLAFNLSATIVGQLNYNDRFVNGANTGRYELTHRMLAWGTVGTFAATGLLALFAPAPPARTDEGFDRLSLHKLCMASATAAMAAEAVLGITTAGHEGRLDQSSLGKVHLAIGYFTFAAIAIGFGALVF